MNYKKSTDSGWEIPALWMIYFHSSKNCGAGFSMNILQATPWSRLRSPQIKIRYLLDFQDSVSSWLSNEVYKDGFVTSFSLKICGLLTTCLANQVLWWSFLTAAICLHNKMSMTCNEILGKTGRCSDCVGQSPKKCLQFIPMNLRQKST